jgi:drug/metabolite transporter (DMT)-like permease
MLIKAFHPLTIHKKGTKSKAIFALIVVCFLWGTTWVAAKIGVDDMPALQLSGIRQLLGGTCYIIFFLSKRATLPKGKEWVTIIILSLLNFALTNGLCNLGVKYISAGLGAIIGAIFPLWIVIIGLFSVREKIPSRAIIGLLLGFGGVCIIFYEHFSDFFNTDFRFGIIVSLIATVTWAFGSLYTKKHAAGFNPYFSLGWQMFISGIVLLIFSRATNSATTKSFIPIAAISLKSWLAIAYLVVFGSVLAFVAYLYALQNLPTEQVSIYAYINPIVAVLVSWLLFRDHISPFLMIGGAVTLIGVYMVNKAFTISPPVEQPETEGM